MRGAKAYPFAFSCAGDKNPRIRTRNHSPVGLKYGGFWNHEDFSFQVILLSKPWYGRAGGMSDTQTYERISSRDLYLLRINIFSKNFHSVTSLPVLIRGYKMTSFSVSSGYLSLPIGSWILLYTHRQRPTTGYLRNVPPELRLGQYPMELKAEWDAPPVSPRKEHTWMTLAMGLCVYFMVFPIQSMLNCLLMSMGI